MTENTGVAPPLYGVVEEPDDEQISAAEVAEVVEGRTGMPKAVATTVDTSEGVTLDDFAGTHTSTADQATSGQAVEAPATMLPAEPTAEQKISQLEAALAFARGSADRFAADLQAERRNRDSSERIAFFRRKEILKLEDQARQLAQRHERELIDQRKAFESYVRRFHPSNSNWQAIITQREETKNNRRLKLYAKMGGTTR